AHEIKKEQRQELVRLLKNLRFEIRGFRPLEEAVVTRGGIAVSEINPKTMESKICKGLYLSGEMIDVDAFTGGYNLQIALSTGRLAGLSAAAAVRQE
ncbi:MAG: NAD(P)/FAD-dependent oxidoreductase, partial [Clostridia bacterium]|nr:NAD(P)/FAD-dependent oxidoreductase [Clostridia bacterium]